MSQQWEQAEHAFDFATDPHFAEKRRAAQLVAGELSAVFLMPGVTAAGASGSFTRAMSGVLPKARAMAPDVAVEELLVDVLWVLAGRTSLLATWLAGTDAARLLSLLDDEGERVANLSKLELVQYFRASG